MRYMILIAVLVGVVLAGELLQAWFRGSRSLMRLFLAEAVAATMLVLSFVVDQLNEFRIVAFMVAIFFIMWIPFLWRDGRLQAEGRQPVRPVLPTRANTVQRVVLGGFALLVVVVTAGAIVANSVEFDWETFLFLVLVAGTAGYVATTSKVPAWTAKVLSADQRASEDAPDANAS